MSDYHCVISVSKDGGHDFLAETTHPIGPEGKFQVPAIRRRLGTARDMVLKNRVTSPIRADLVAFEVMAEAEQ